MQKLLVCIVLSVYCSGLFSPVSVAAVALPPAGVPVRGSELFVPALLKGVRFFADEPFRLEFFVDAGDGIDNDALLEAETDRLIKYFLAALTLPERDVWVNLSPYESERIVPEALGRTQLGQDLLAQDYVLKQLSASLVHPDEEGGKHFWREVYRAARELYGTSDIPVDTFNKVWVVPATAGVYATEGGVFIVDSSLKVLGEEDYLALSQAGQAFGDDLQKQLSLLSGQALRTAILPLLGQEVNHGRDFAPLRQIYSAVILAVWFRRHLRDTILGRAYADRGLVRGIEAEDADMKEKIYQQYLAAFRKGVFDFVREEIDTDGTLLPRKYFSGGAEFGQVSLEDRSQSAFELVGGARIFRGKIFRAVADLVKTKSETRSPGEIKPIRWEGVESIRELDYKVLRMIGKDVFRLGRAEIINKSGPRNSFYYPIINPDTGEPYERPVGFSGEFFTDKPLIVDLNLKLNKFGTDKKSEPLLGKRLGSSFLRHLLALSHDMVIEGGVENLPTRKALAESWKRGEVSSENDWRHVFIRTILGKSFLGAGVKPEEIFMTYYRDASFLRGAPALESMLRDWEMGLFIYPVGFHIERGAAQDAFDASQKESSGRDVRRFLQRLDNMTLREVDGEVYRLGEVRITPLSRKEYKFSYPVIDPRTGQPYEDPLGFSGVIEAGAAKVKDLDLRLQDQNAPATGNFLLGKGLGNVFQRELLSLHPQMVIETSIENVPTMAAIDTAIEQGLIRTADDLKQVFLSSVLGKSVLASGAKPHEVVMTYYGISYFRDDILPENQQAVDQLLADRRAGMQFRVGYRIDRRLSHVASAADAVKGGVDLSSALVPLDVSGQKDSVLNQAEMAELTQIEGLRPVILRMEKVDDPAVITRALRL